MTNLQQLPGAHNPCAGMPTDPNPQGPSASLQPGTESLSSSVPTAGAPERRARRPHLQRRHPASTDLALFHGASLEISRLRKLLRDNQINPDTGERA